jgi:hypothetical protein
MGDHNPGSPLPYLPRCGWRFRFLAGERCCSPACVAGAEPRAVLTLEGPTMAEGYGAGGDQV